MSVIAVAVDHLVLNVADVETSAAWYQNVLGMTRKDSEKKRGVESRTVLKFGEQKINLRPVTASKREWFTADHEMPGSSDLCFLTESSPDEVVQHLKKCGVTVEQGPVKKHGAIGILLSVYCRDPDGSLIEISSYEMKE